MEDVGEYKLMSKDELRVVLDADNMDSKTGIRRVCHLVTGNVSRLMSELTDRVVIYELLAIHPDHFRADLMKDFLAKKDEIDQLSMSVISTLAIIDAVLNAIVVSGTDQYLFVNRFLHDFEIAMNAKDNAASRLNYLATIATNTAEFADKVAQHGKTS